MAPPNRSLSAKLVARLGLRRAAGLVALAWMLMVPCAAYAYGPQAAAAAALGLAFHAGVFVWISKRSRTRTPVAAVPGASSPPSPPDDAHPG